MEEKPTIAGQTVYLDPVTKMWAYTGNDKITYDYDQSRKAWFPRVTEELIQSQQEIYKVAGVDESAPVEKPSIKRKREKMMGLNAQEDKKKTKKVEKKNTAVFVTGLPQDVSPQEIADVFKKGGVFLLDPITSAPKIKLYKNQDGQFEGNALVIYLREESVQLACQLLDETSLRIGEQLKMTVNPAVFKEKDPKPQEDFVDKKAKQRAFQKMKKQLEWFEDEKPKIVKKSVVLKHIFTLEQLEATPELLLDLKQDVRSECENFGTVTNVTLFDLEEDGILLVKFGTEMAALACVQKMNGRFYDGRKIEAYISEGREAFKKSSRDNEEEEKKRQEEYGKWLEGEEDEE